MDHLDYILDNFSDEYAEFIMKHAAGDRIICNGDTLLEAMEDGYLLEEFIPIFEALNEGYLVDI